MERSKTPGKTARNVERARELGAVLVVRNQQEVIRVKKTAPELDIISFSHWKSHKLGRPGQKYIFDSCRAGSDLY